MKTKIIHIKTGKTCSSCFFSTWDSNYSMSQDSGYDCGIEFKRIADDSLVENYAKHQRAVEESKKTFFPIEDSQTDPMEVPSWCPLLSDEKIVL